MTTEQKNMYTKDRRITCTNKFLKNTKVTRKKKCPQKARITSSSTPKSVSLVQKTKEVTEVCPQKTGELV